VTSDDLRVLVVGLGQMGMSHARAYAALPGYRLAGLCARSIARRTDLPPEWDAVPRYADYETTLRRVRPDVVSINTYADTHAAYTLGALDAGAHVVVEKPLAESVAGARRVVKAAPEPPSQGGLRLHSPGPSGLEGVRGAGPRTRPTAGDADEPEPAVVR
jgi:predicted dehydrogenase